MNGGWIVIWVASGFTIGALYVMILTSIFDGIAERREHRRKVEHEIQMMRLETKAVTPF